MEYRTRQILLIGIAIIALLVIVRGCQRIKEVKVNQKSTDTATKLSINIQKEPEHVEKTSD
jgi:hypothetical protein